MDFCTDDSLKLDYLNGMLSEEERSCLEEHLAACPGCRREIVELRKTAALVAGLTSPSVLDAWTAAAKDRLRAKNPSPVASVPLSPAPARWKTNVFQYAVVTAAVIAGLVFLFWLILGGAVQRWLPGISTAARGISEPRAARTIDLITWILALHSLLFVPSIIDNVCQIVRKGRGLSRSSGRRS